MIIYRTGDLLQADEDVIAHGCNCVGGFGSGVAGQIAKKWPVVKNHYLYKYDRYGWTLGEIQPVTMPFTGYTVVNCATQQFYLPRGIRHADYDAIEKAMLSLKEYAIENNFSIAIPKIGAGLAGGDWNVIEKILEKIFFDYDITVYEL